MAFEAAVRRSFAFAVVESSHFDFEGGAHALSLVVGEPARDRVEPQLSERRAGQIRPRQLGRLAGGPQGRAQLLPDSIHELGRRLVELHGPLFAGRPLVRKQVGLLATVSRF